MANATLAVDVAVSGVAVTAYVPGMQFDVQLTLATPLLSVIANGLDSVHDAPKEGAVKSTRTPGAVLPESSDTVARIVEPVTAAWIVAFGGASTAP